VQAFLRLATIDVALRTVGFRWLIRRAPEAALPTARPVEIEELRRAQRYAHLIEMVARHHTVPARCLHRSLVLHHWLRAEGLPSELRIGVRKDGGDLKAHAWVDLGGWTLGDPPGAVDRFTTLSAARRGTHTTERASRRSSVGPIAEIDTWGVRWQ
jgi:hypothetical protein